MDKEKYLGEAALKDKPEKKFNLMIRDGSVTTYKLADSAVTTYKLNDKSVTLDKMAQNSVGTDNIVDNSITNAKMTKDSVSTDNIQDASITNDKMGSNSVGTLQIVDESITESKLADESVTTEKVQDKSITLDKMSEGSVNTDQVVDESIINTKLSKDSVSTEKIQDKSVTNEKLADNTLTLDKFDPELRETINAATGLPDNLVELIQNVDENLAKLNDTVYPITLDFKVNSNVSTMKTDVNFSVLSEGKPLQPDTLTISKKVNDTNAVTLTDLPVPSGNLSTPIEGNREVFSFNITKEGRTSKSISKTKYLCFSGGNSVATMTTDILNTLNRIVVDSVSFNPKVTTKDSEYIWLVVPSYLSISRVTSAGFDVTLATPQTITNSLGTFKAYRTANPLTVNTWNLVIS